MVLFWKVAPEAVILLKVTWQEFVVATRSRWKAVEPLLDTLVSLLHAHQKRGSDVTRTKNEDVSRSW